MSKQIMQLTFSKQEIIQKIRENRNRHKELYDEALVGYRQNLKKALQRKLIKAEAGEQVDHSIRVTRPTNYLREYDRVLGMLEACVEETIEFDEQQFSCYMLDAWSWKSHFLDTCNPHGVSLTDMEKSYLNDYSVV